MRWIPDTAAGMSEPGDGAERVPANAPSSILGISAECRRLDTNDSKEWLGSRLWHLGVVDMPNPVVAVVDSDPESCRSTAALLRSVRHEVFAYEHAEDLLGEHGQRPWDCILTELRLSDMPGLELLRRLAELGELAPVVFYTRFATVEIAVRALKQGAFDFLERETCHDNVLDAVYRAAHEARRRRVVAADRSHARSRIEKLTPREHEVMELVAAGFTTKEVAKRLGLSQGTVSIHRYRAMQKLGARSAANLGSILKIDDAALQSTRGVSRVP